MSQGRQGVDDDLDDKVFLDLGVLQPRLVREQLAGEEPALVRGVDVLLGVELLLQLADGVRHAGAEAQVFPRGHPYLDVTGITFKKKKKTFGDVFIQSVL